MMFPPPPSHTLRIVRLELGNVVTGEGEREGRVVVGDKTDTVWEGKPTCVKGKPTCVKPP
jgi:hypothetical protein